ncbi:MAG TPA: fused MFS/spermidine synthase, partial [Rubrobacteraceae bacterium]
EPPGGAPNPPVGSGGGAPETGAPLTETSGESSAPTFWRRARWVGLTFVPSSLMLGVTAFITTNITPIPLLWVIPLSLYLLSFTIVFSPFQRVPDIVHKVMVGALPVLMTTLVLTALTELRRPYWALILLHLLGFFVVAMVLHGEVARDRPAARHLTEFYLWVAVGGVLGGLFNALIAPVAFDTVVEYPLAIVLACLFVPGAILARLLTRRPEERQGEDDSQGEERETITSSGSRTLGSRQLALVLDFALPVALGLVILAFGWLVDWGYFDPIMERYNVWQIFIGLSAAVCLWFAYASSRPIRFGLGIAALLIAVTFANGVGNVLFEDRSFFGVYRVSGDAGTENAYHALVVGDTNHGAQLFGSQPPTPIAYHDPSGPFGQLFELLPSEATDESPVAVLGLGAGVMSCYAEPGQRWTYYEIDPLVERIARNENLFTYLRDCPGEYDVEIGDARLKLSEAEDESYGMVIGEAFSSDAIPVHMLTREATDMYFEKLNENGVLVHHISNRHLELEPVVGDLARDRGLTCYQSYDDLSDTQPSATSPYKLAAHFTVLARDEADLGSVPDDPRWAPCATNDDTDKVWTDDYSNILSTFAFE